MKDQTNQTEGNESRIKNETLEEISCQVKQLQAEGFEALDMFYSEDVGSGFGYAGETDKKFLKMAKNVHPESSFNELTCYAPPAPQSGNELLRERTIIPVNIPETGTPGKGYIPWGPVNSLPNFIYQTSRSLPYTARSLQFLRDQIVGLGVEFVYRFSRPSGGTVVTKEIPYKDAGLLIRDRIRELEAEKRQQNGGEVSIVNLMDLKENGSPKPGTVEYELGELRNDYAVWERTQAEVQQFMQNNNLYKHQLDCMEDFVPMEIYYPLIGLSRGEPGKDWAPKIVSLRHISCCAARLEEMDDKRNINYVYYSDLWRGLQGFNAMLPREGEVVAYPALPETDTMNYLQNIVERKKKVGVRSRPTWFCMPRRMPCMNALYYPVPYWWSIYSSDVYNYAATIIADRSAARMNSTMWGKIIMVNHNYMERLWAANGCDTAEKKRAFRNQFKENIDKFLRNRENNGSTAMFESVVSPDGNTLWDSVKIIDVPINTNNVSAGKAELTEISNVIFLAMGIHSVLMGNELNASSSTGGTVQRELDLLSQKHLAPMQKNYLDLLNFVRDWNDWDPKHGLFRSLQVSLTTLDASKTGTTEVNGAGVAD